MFEAELPNDWTMVLKSILSVKSLKKLFQPIHFHRIQILRNYDTVVNHTDTECDIKTGRNVGIKTILVRTGYGSEEEKKGLHSDYVVNDLRDAVSICMNINTGDRNK